MPAAWTTNRPARWAWEPSARTAGVTASGTVKIETTGAASNLTLNNAVSSSAAGDAVVLKAGSSNAAGIGTGGQLINNVGAGGIVAASGRYLVYSGGPRRHARRRGRLQQALQQRCQL